MGVAISRVQEAIESSGQPFQNPWIRVHNPEARHNYKLTGDDMAMLFSNYGIQEIWQSRDGFEAFFVIVLMDRDGVFIAVNEIDGRIFKNQKLVLDCVLDAQKRSVQKMISKIYTRPSGRGRALGALDFDGTGKRHGTAGSGYPSKKAKVKVEQSRQVDSLAASFEFSQIVHVQGIPAQATISDMKVLLKDAPIQEVILTPPHFDGFRRAYTFWKSCQDVAQFFGPTEAKEVNLEGSMIKFHKTKFRADFFDQAKSGNEHTSLRPRPLPQPATPVAPTTRRGARAARASRGASRRAQGKDGNDPIWGEIRGDTGIMGEGYEGYTLPPQSPPPPQNPPREAPGKLKLTKILADPFVQGRFRPQYDVHQPDFRLELMMYLIDLLEELHALKNVKVEDGVTLDSWSERLIAHEDVIGSYLVYVNDAVGPLR